MTPRKLDASNKLKPLDQALSVAVNVDVGPFKKKGLSLGFARGFTQSQAFVRHFGLNASIRPKDKQLLFDTTKEAGVNAKGEHFTFDDSTVARLHGTRTGLRAARTRSCPTRRCALTCSPTT